MEDNAARLRRALTHPFGLNDYEIEHTYSFDEAEERILVDLLESGTIRGFSRQTLVRALGHATGPRGLTALRVVLSGKEDPWLRLEAGASLGLRIGGEATPELLDLLASTRGEPRESALRLLGIFGDVRAWTTVIELLKAKPPWLLRDEAGTYALLYAMRNVDGPAGARTTELASILDVSLMRRLLGGRWEDLWKCHGSGHPSPETQPDPDLLEGLRLESAQPWTPNRELISWSSGVEPIPLSYEEPGQRDEGRDGPVEVVNDYFAIERAGLAADFGWASNPDEGGHFVVSLNESLTEDEVLTDEIFEIVATWPGVIDSYRQDLNAIIVLGTSVDIDALGRRLAERFSQQYE